jgi:hypothetical protein
VSGLFGVMDSKREPTVMSRWQTFEHLLGDPLELECCIFTYTVSSAHVQF